MIKPTEIFGIILGIVLYGSYILYFRHETAISFRNFEGEHNSTLPHVLSSDEICEKLRNLHSPHIRDGILDNSMLTKPQLFQWQSLGCSKRDIITKQTTAVLPIRERIHHVITVAEAAEAKALGVSTETFHSDTCDGMLKKYHVVPGSSWGTLPLDLQRTWSKMTCDKLVTKLAQNIHHETKPEEVDAAVVEPEAAVEQEHEKAVEQHQQANPPSGNAEWCHDTKEKYKVLPMKSWGSLPLSLVDMWRSRGCDAVFTSLRMLKKPLSTCFPAVAAGSSGGVSATAAGSAARLTISGGGGGSKASAAAVSPVAALASLFSGTGKDAAVLTQAELEASSASLPLIAIMAATTTRKVKNPAPGNMALFTYLLPSLIRTIDCGYRYEYVLGYDVGDPFYDSKEGMKTTREWFEVHVAAPMRKNGINIRLRTVRVNNTLKKPGPVFLHMARAAYEAGAEYFYRINDDTELSAPWPNAFVGAIRSLTPPYGVVGPECNQGNQKILTHDFVHRTHMEIFEMNYYPAELTDWWMDDWISWVYGQKRTFEALKVPVIHHTGAHGQRYEVDRSHEHLLGSLVESGRKKIRNWMLSHNVNDSVLREFDKDVYAPGFVHIDIPKTRKSSQNHLHL